MSKRKKHPNKKTAPSAKHARTKRGPNWRKIIERSLFATAILLMIGVAAAAYNKNKKLEYDLSVIGNGKATVVQVHDPNCQLCRRLKKNLDSVKGDFQAGVQFKTANLANSEGRRFSRVQQVPHVTLVFFDGRGQRVNSLQGVTPAAEIRTALQALTSN